MQITDVRVYLRKDEESKVKGVATITIDSCFVVKGIYIFEKDGENFVGMPRKRAKNGTFQDVAHPINAETRKMIQDAVIAEYQKQLKAFDEKKEETNSEENKDKE